MPRLLGVVKCVRCLSTQPGDIEAEGPTVVHRPNRRGEQTVRSEQSPGSDSKLRQSWRMRVNLGQRRSAPARTSVLGRRPRFLPSHVAAVRFVPARPKRVAVLVRLEFRCYNGKDSVNP